MASAGDSVKGKVERRRRDAGTEPQRNDRHRTAGGKPADPSASGNAARDERAFLRSGTGAVVRGPGRTAGGEEQQECALVTAGFKIRFPVNNIFLEFAKPALVADKKVKLFSRCKH